MKNRQTLMDVELTKEIREIEEFTHEYWKPMLKAAQVSKKELPSLAGIIENIIKTRTEYVAKLKELLGSPL